MTKKKIVSLTAVLLVIAVLVCGFSTYAWFYIGDNAGTMTFQIARVNSEVYFYTAKDSNINGVVDLLSSGDSPTPVDEKYSKPEYYKETRYFNYKAYAEAKAETTSAETITTITLGDYLTDILPTQVYTIKLSLVNKSDAENDIAIRLKEIASLSDANKKLYSAFAMRVVKVINEDGLKDTEPTFEKEDWVYLCDSIDGSKFNELAVIENDKVSGLDQQTLADKEGNGKIVNVSDYWLQFKLLSYDEYSAKIGEKDFGISSLEDFQTLQGTSFSFDLSILFEVNVDV